VLAPNVLAGHSLTVPMDNVDQRKFWYRQPNEVMFYMCFSPMNSTLLP
jgi:hypothetical protein